MPGHRLAATGRHPEAAATGGWEELRCARDPATCLWEAGKGTLLGAAGRDEEGSLLKREVTPEGW